MNRLLLHFVLIFTVSYIALLWLGSTNTIRGSLQESLCSYGNSIHGEFRKKGITRFDQEHPEKLTADEIMISITNMKQIREAKQRIRKGDKNAGARGKTFELNTWNFIYLPLAFFLSLLIASPVKLKQKGIAFIAGIPLLLLFFHYKIYVLLYSKFFLEEWLMIDAKDGFFYKMMEKLSVVFVHIGTSLFIVTAIWFLLTFTRKDLQNWFGEG